MPNSSKRTYLEIAFVTTILLGSIVFLIVGPKATSKVYDCSLAEISPDYPIEVRQQCRKLRSDKINEQKN